MFSYVPVGVSAEVRTINLAETESLDGTKTDGSDHHAVVPGMSDKCSAVGTTPPSKAATLVNVTLKLTVSPLAACRLAGCATGRGP